MLQTYTKFNELMIEYIRVQDSLLCVCFLFKENSVERNDPNAYAVNQSRNRLISSAEATGKSLRRSFAMT